MIVPRRQKVNMALCTLISASFQDSDKLENIETAVLTVSDDLLGFE